MKKIIILYLGFVIFGGSVLYAQQDSKLTLQEKITSLERQMLSLEKERDELSRQSDSLAALVQELKSKKKLNIFQRQRLEQLLKTSQAIDRQLTKLDRLLSGSQAQYQQLLKKIVKQYDREIEQILDNIKTNKKGTEKQQTIYERLKTLKSERDNYVKKLTPFSLTIPVVRSITIDENDTYQTIKQKADLLKDQEDKVEKQKQLVNRQIVDLQNELKLRTRMNELISDTYLMDYRPETPAPSAQTKGVSDISQAFNSYRDGKSSLATSPPLDAGDLLVLQTDVSDISTLDLEFYIQKLKRLVTELKQSADSLRRKADQFYKVADQKRKDMDK